MHRPCSKVSLLLHSLSTSSPTPFLASLSQPCWTPQGCGSTLWCGLQHAFLSNCPFLRYGITPPSFTVVSDQTYPSQIGLLTSSVSCAVLLQDPVFSALPGSPSTGTSTVTPAQALNAVCGVDLSGLLTYRFPVSVNVTTQCTEKNRKNADVYKYSTTTH